MTQHSSRTFVGLLGGMAATVAVTLMLAGCGPDSMETRTPIDVASLGPQVGEPLVERLILSLKGRYCQQQYY